jgi:hypothetical protein
VARFGAGRIAERNLSANEGFEFGYAFGVARPLSTIASAEQCTFCRENFRAGVEAYGGLGSSVRFGLQDTAHYVAPVISWRISPNASLRFSAAFGLTSSSQLAHVRASYSYEIGGVGRAITSLFKSKQ